MNLIDLIWIDRYEYMVLVVDFILVVAMLTAVGKMTGVVANVNSIKELSHKDNFSFGISYAGAILALGIMMTGTVSGDETISLVYEASIVFAYGILGILLMAITRHFLDKVSLPHISIHQQIINGNMAAGIVDAANMIGTAIIVRAAMIWVDTEAFSGLLVVLGGFVVSQIIMILVTRYRLFVYAKRHNGENLQKEFEAGNIAIAIRYLGHKIGVALAVTAASGITEYTYGAEIQAALLWFGFSIVMTILLSILSIIARHIILRGINVVEEVDDQKNIGIGLIEATIYIVNGVVLAALFAVPTV